MSAGQTTLSYSGSPPEMASVSCGWPMRCVRLVWADGHLREGIELPSSWRAKWALSIWTFPTHILWPGFLLNSLLYALPIALLWLTPRRIRRWHRTRNHLCLHCAYPVADPTKPCTECGKPVSR